VSRSPRSEPARVYRYFCDLTKDATGKQRQPGELNLTKAEFHGLVGQFFVAPRRKEHFAKLQPIISAWNANAKVEEQGKQRSYVRRRRKSITDNLWPLLGRLYWDYAAWIILRGEYKSLKKTLSENEIMERLQNQYHYLSQVKARGWFNEMQTTPPLDSAYQDIVERLNSKGWKLNKDSLRVMLSPKSLRESPPASLSIIGMDSKKLLSRLLRIPKSRRTHKDKMLILAIKAEAC
jgi:hypothetical protein